MISQRSMMTGGLLAAGSSALFTGKVIVAKLAYERGLDPLGMLTLRMLFSCPFFLVILLYKLRKGISFSLSDALAAFFLGFLGYYLSSMFDFYGIQHISTALERMILQLSPSVVMLIGVVFLREQLDFRLIVAMMIGYLGVGCMVYSEVAGVGADGNTAGQWIGVLCLAACVLFFAFYVMGAERLMRRVDSGLFTSLAMTGATAGVGIHYFIARGLAAPTRDGVACLLGMVMAVFCTVLPSYMVNMAIHRIGGARMGPFNYVGMGLTFVVSALVVDEVFPPVKVLGIALAVAGAMLLTFSHKRRLSA
jgi:drug/metabolite transporter (DMT)-like permease